MFMIKNKIFLTILFTLTGLIMANDTDNKKAVFAAGCFWGVESTFQQMEGVKTTTVGYIGGKVKNPSYELVCTGLTGHAEAVEVEYNPQVVSFETLLDTFFQLHDPTTMNRQGPDVGTQYRSAAYFSNNEEKKIWKLEETTDEWKKENIEIIKKRLKGWQLKSFEESYTYKIENGISLFKKNLKNE